jgi:malonyl CoA-acyl carrier protein transacylase
MNYAVLFPGQGSQAVGMGADLFERHPDLLGPPADEILGWSLRAMCLDGPEEALTRTEHAQPALYSVSFALWRELEMRLAGPPVSAGGHSLGEYTALAAAGMVDFFDGLRLVAARGQAMAAAADHEESGMAALIGADPATAEALAGARRNEGGRLWVANLNAPGQVVVAGGAEDIEWAEANVARFGIRRAKPLKVAGAFHSPFMAAAARELNRAVAAVTTRQAAFPVWSNVTAEPHGDDVGPMLVAQLTAPVRFAESVLAMESAGVDVFVHVGPGDVTAGLAKRSVQSADAIAVSSLDGIAAVVDRLQPSAG